MEIRKANKSDLLQICALGEEMGHLMFYQKDPELLRPYLREIIVAEEDNGIIGYYHYLTIPEDPQGWNRVSELLRCIKQFPEFLIARAAAKAGKLCVCMQGASHREVFREFVLWMQKRYPEVWCWCSVKSKRPDTYKDLGFVFREWEGRSFYNIHAGYWSTYQLGVWKRK